MEASQGLSGAGCSRAEGEEEEGARRGGGGAGGHTWGGAPSEGCTPHASPSGCKRGTGVCHRRTRVVQLVPSERHEEAVDDLAKGGGLRVHVNGRQEVGLVHARACTGHTRGTPQEHLRELRQRRTPQVGAHWRAQGPRLQSPGTWGLAHARACTGTPVAHQRHSPTPAAPPTKQPSSPHPPRPLRCDLLQVICHGCGWPRVWFTTGPEAEGSPVPV